MKVLSTDGLTKLIQLIKSNFIKTTDTVEATTVQLATVATSGSYNDLSNKPTIPAAQVNSDWNASSGVAQILNKPTLATVATSGSYNDLSNKPTIPDTSNLANKDLSNLSNTGNAKFQEPLVSGTNIKTINNNSILGSGDITIQSAPDIDNKSITTNTSDELQTVGVIDSNNTTNAIKTWTGTKAQYDAIVTKDNTTMYYLTDAYAIYLGDILVVNLANRNIGEIVSSTIPLTDAGLHLLDGALIDGNGIYSAFVDYIAGLYEADPTASYFAQSNTTVAYNFNITGNLTNDNGILSNFANNVYASLPNAWISENYDTWEMVFDITTGSDVSTQQFIYSNFINSSGTYSGVNYQIDLSKFKLELRIGSSSSAYRGTYTVLPNTHYLIRIKFTGSAYTLEYSTDNGLTWITDINYASTTKVTTRSEGYFIIGGLYYQYHSGVRSPFYGSINLNNSYIKVNNSVFWEGVTVTGFTPEQEWQQSITTYGVCGKFVYDSVNNTVRLPKVTGIIEGTTDVTALGDLVEAGLPNITGSFNVPNGSSVSQPTYYNTQGCFNVSQSATYSGNAQGGGSGGTVQFNASRSSSIYGNSSTVQPQTTKVFYYIVIATSTKTDIQVDIDEIATDLNEIATDLNGKADVDLSNINPTQNVKNTIVGWGMPDYSAGVSVSDTGTFICPSDGCIGFRTSDANNTNASTPYVNGTRVVANGWCSTHCYYPFTFFVSKNDVVTWTNNSYDSVITFFPLKGAN